MSGESNSIVYKNEFYMEECSPIMYELLQEKKFCDVRLKIGDEVFSAHRLVLASSIPYFYPMFTSDMVESRQDEIELNEIEPSALADLIEYAYTGKVRIKIENAVNLLIAASYLQVVRVFKACETFLIGNLQPDNVLGFKRLAESLVCNDLKLACVPYIDKHFTKIVHTLGFLTLEMTELLDILKRDDLYVESEMIVYEACCRWIQFNKERRSYFPLILTEIRLLHLPIDFVNERVISEVFVENPINCTNLLAEVERYIMEHSPSCLKTYRNRTRRYTGYLFVICGYENEAGWPVNSLEYYDPYKEKWIMGEKSLINRKYFGVASMNNKIYSVGGEMVQVFVTSGYGSEALQMVEVYDPVQKKWSKSTEMLVKRKSPAVTAFQNCLYVCGGIFNSFAVNKVEFFCPELNLWQQVAPMNTNRSRFCAVTLNGYIYVMGGFGTVEVLDSVERYDPHKDKWEHVCPMVEPRCDYGATVHDGRIYVCGGYNHNQQLDTMELYDPDRDEWFELEPMANSKAGVILCSYMGDVWAVGGYDESSNETKELTTVDIYHPKTDTWSAGPPTNRRNAYGGAAVFPVHLFEEAN